MRITTTLKKIRCSRSPRGRGILINTRRIDEASDNNTTVAGRDEARNFEGCGLLDSFYSSHSYLRGDEEKEWLERARVDANLSTGFFSVVFEETWKSETKL
uniref:Uncharacterized protein n=1 Tax=Lygus hesperus TaxID=30085 RepID=A0A146KTG3_LYGHE